MKEREREREGEGKKERAGDLEEEERRVHGVRALHAHVGDLAVSGVEGGLLLTHLDEGLHAGEERTRPLGWVWVRVRE